MKLPSSEVWLATNNTGKVGEIRSFLASYQVPAVTPGEQGYQLPSVIEDGLTLAANAKKKAQALAAIAPAGTVVLADDTGVEITALQGEPGIFVRRWRDHQNEMTDQEIIDYTMERLRGVPIDQRQVRMRSAVIVQRGSEQQVFFGEIAGYILETPLPLLIPGFPFESMVQFPQWQMSLGDIHQLTIEQRPNQLTHRERALLAALPTLQSWLR